MIVVEGGTNILNLFNNTLINNRGFNYSKSDHTLRRWLGKRNRSKVTPPCPRRLSGSSSKPLEATPSWGKGVKEHAGDNLEVYSCVE